MYKFFTNSLFTGRDLIYLPECHSTNDIASDLIKQKNITEGSVVITDHQISGRGQPGNSWESNPAKNLTFTIVLMPEFLSPDRIFYLNIISSLALLDYLIGLDENSFHIKWPNDIYYENNKIAGILIENNINSSVIVSSVVGIGFNVNQEKFQDSYNARSLKMIFRKDFKLNRVFNEIIQKFEKRYLQLQSNQFSRLKSAYLKNLYWLGESHHFHSQGGSFKGIIKGIDDLGRIVIEKENDIKKFDFQEIKFVK